MITIISGTNNRNSTTLKVAHIYFEYLKEKGIPCQLLDICEMPVDIISADQYYQVSDPFKVFQEEYLVAADKFIIAVPEYNGGIPGIFKMMVDTSDIQNCWWGKKACLTGISSGRSGNLRGLDYLSNILNYLKVNVMFNKLPISRCDTLLDEDGKFHDALTIQLIKEQTDQMLEF